MNFEDLPTLKHLEQSTTGFKYILKIYSFLKFFGIRNKKMDEAKEKFDELCTMINEHKNYAKKFNDFFSKDGWIVHESLNFDLIKNAADKFEDEGEEEAKKLLLAHFNPENIQQNIFRLRFCKEFNIRYKFIEYALKDYKAERYYSTIPLLLMVIDGAVNDSIQTGFHAQSIDLSVWDSITSIDGGINSVKAIFQKSRKRTTTDAINLPYRHGILHGRDLSYDNYEVAAKAWNFLFIVHDWINAKRTEQARKEKFIKETHMPSIKESLNSLVEIQQIKEKIKEWKPRNIDKHYIERINNGKHIDNLLPEYTAAKYCALWCKKNYGYMSNLYAHSWKQKPKELREQYDWLDLDNYEIINITDEASAISEVFVKITLKDGSSKECKLRIVYENEKGDPLPRNIDGGVWKIVIIYLI